jgi:hypothetical protein
LTVRWLAESLEHGAPAARVGRDGARLVAEWTRRARLSVNSDGSDLTFEPHDGADERDVEKLRRGAVRLLLAHLAGSIPLHGSAVAINRRAIVFVGGSDFGKSTLAAALCDHHGASLLGDDAVIIERRSDGFHVVALEESHWLDAASARALGRPDAFADKRPLAPRRSEARSAALALIVHLVFSETETEPRLVPLTGLEAIGGLLSQLTRFVVDDPDVSKRDLASLADLVDRTPVVRLERPRRLALLAQTASEVAAVVEAGASIGEPR